MSTVTQLSIAERVMKIIRDQLAMYGAAPDVMADDYHLFDEGGFDSLDLVETTLWIEDELDVEIPDEVMWEIRTVGDAINAVTNAQVTP